MERPLLPNKKQKLKAIPKKELLLLSVASFGLAYVVAKILKIPVEH